MDSSVLIAIISASIPALASIIINKRSNETALISNQKISDKNRELIEYRIGQLEDKVNKHNHVIERVYNLEKDRDVFNERLNSIESHHS